MSGLNKKKSVLESLFSMNYLTRKWSQVQNVCKNAMTIDTSELNINVLSKWNPDLFTIKQKTALLFFHVTYGLSWSTTYPLVFRPATLRKTQRPTHPQCVTWLLKMPILDWNLKKTIVIFEISTLEYFDMRSSLQK